MMLGAQVKVDGRRFPAVEVLDLRLMLIISAQRIVHASQIVVRNQNNAPHTFYKLLHRLKVQRNI